VVGFVGKDSLFGSMASPPFLATSLFQAGTFGAEPRFLEGLKFVEEQLAGKKAVLSLVTGGLAFNLETSRPVNQEDASGGLVDVLATMAAGTDECFLKVRLRDAQSRHALGEFVGCSGC
jgi:hypothetical protein